MPTNTSEDTLAQQANFIFKGTVQKLKASSIPDIPVDDRTVTVRVDEVVQAPTVLADFAGREITVVLTGRKKVKAGEQVIFYTNTWIFGEGIAVRAIDIRPATLGVAAMGVVPGDPAKNLADKESRVRFENAAVVVSGQVMSVSLPAQEVAAGGFAAAAVVGDNGETVLAKPISEHDPLIQEAVVAVNEVHKGEHSGKEIVVRFPSSTDVKWHAAPKFRPGQQGFFMLHRPETQEPVPTAPVVSSMFSADEREDVLFALHPADFQPLDRPGGVRNLIAAQPEPIIPPDET